MFPFKVVDDSTLEFEVDSQEIELYNRYPVGYVFSINWGGPWSHRKLKVVAHNETKTVITCKDV